MKQTTYNKVSGLVFLIVTIAHAIRAFNNWTLTVGSYELPVWVSWAAVMVLAYLAINSFRMK